MTRGRKNRNRKARKFRRFIAQVTAFAIRYYTPERIAELVAPDASRALLACFEETSADE